MNLFDQVSSDIKAAMLAKDKVRLETLRGIKKEFLEAKTAKGGNGELADDAATKILVKMVKQRKETAAIYTEQGAKEIEETLDYYRNNARVIKEGLEKAGYEVYGAVNSPYVWCKTPEGMGSWEFFQMLLEKANVITTPGAGFGPSGEGYIRLTAFGDADETAEAVRRIQALS